MGLLAELRLPRLACLCEDSGSSEGAGREEGVREIAGEDKGKPNSEYAFSSSRISSFHPSR